MYFMQLIVHHLIGARPKDSGACFVARGCASMGPIWSGLVYTGQQFVQVTTGSTGLRLLHRLSMVVTGFEIFGAVGTAIALLNMARQGFESLKKDYKDYKNYGQKVAKTHRSCEQMYYLIEEWSSFWDLNVQMSDDWYKAYWSERGWRLIQQQLAAVLIQCEDLAAIIDKALPEHIFDQISEVDKERIERRLRERAQRIQIRLSGRAQRASYRDAPHLHPLGRVARMLRNKFKNGVWATQTTEIRVLEEHISNATTVRKKAMYLLSSYDQLQTYLKDLEEEFKKLERLAETAWRDRHGTDYRVSSKTDKQVIALTETHRYVLREAKTQIEEVKALHHCCISTPDNLKLGISLLDGSPAEKKSKIFRIFVPQSGRNVHLEVVTRILGKNAPTNEVKFRPDFSSACKEVHKGGQCLLWTLPGVKSGPVASRQKTWFSVSKVAGPLYQNEASMISLSMKLQEITVAEKLGLAYSVVESSLILLGTSWLSALSSQTLNQYRVNRRQAPRYILSIKENNQSLIRNRFQSEKGGLEQRIFRIGILLAEIALGTVIQDFRKTVSGLQLVITEHETRAQRSYSLQLMVNKVERQMGKSYSEAVGFCLQDPWEPGTLYDSSFIQGEHAMELLEVLYNNILVKSDPELPPEYS